MSKNQQKDEFFENREDDSAWGTPIRASKKKKNLSAMVSIRFSTEEFETIQLAATAQNVTISAYIREAVLEKSISNLPAFQLKTGSSNSAPLTGTYSAANSNFKHQIDFKYKVS